MRRVRVTDIFRRMSKLKVRPILPTQVTYGFSPPRLRRLSTKTSCPQGPSPLISSHPHSSFRVNSQTHGIGRSLGKPGTLPCPSNPKG